MSELYSFFRLNNIPLYVYATFCLSIHPLMDLWLFPPLATVDNATRNVVYKCLFESLLSLPLHPLGVDLEVGLLEHTMTLCLILQDLPYH